MVEWKEICEIAKRNKGIPITAGQMSELDAPDGNIRVFAAGQTVANINESELPSNCAYKEPSIIVKSRGYVDFVFYDKPFTHKNEMWSYSFVNKQFGKYVYYFLTTKTEFFRKKAKANSVKLPQLCVADTDKFLIPIPSQSEQNKIVDILDTFTSSIENLKEQIAQRRKQYEYYRDQLLDLEGKEGVEVKTLNDSCTLITKQTGFDYSKTIKPSLTTKKTEDSIPFIQNKDFEGTRINLNTDFYIPTSVAIKFPKILLNGKILLVSISGKIGNVGLYDIDEVSFVGGAVCVCRLKNDINGKFILYYLLSNRGQASLFHSVKAASHSNITVESIRSTTIPFPTIGEQQRIVDILDTFEASIQNLEAQLAQREKQYGYYRNKLLTFE